MAKAAGIELAGKIVDHAFDLRKELEARKGNDSARSVSIEITNKLSEELSLGSKATTHGAWTSSAMPPRNIPTEGFGACIAESHGTFTGVEGYAKYDIGNTGFDLWIMFNNPYVGSNSNAAYVLKPGPDGTVNMWTLLGNPPPYRAIMAGGEGDNCYLNITLGKMLPFFCRRHFLIDIL